MQGQVILFQLGITELYLTMIKFTRCVDVIEKLQ